MTQAVAVKFLGFLEKLTGQREITLPIEEPATVLDLLNLLSERFGPRFSTSLFRAPEELHTYVRIFVNEEEVESLNRLLTFQNGLPQVAVFLMPAMTGGSGFHG